MPGDEEMIGSPEQTACPVLQHVRAADTGIDANADTTNLCWTGRIREAEADELA